MFCEEFNENVIDHFMSPRNTGTMPDADAIGSSGDPNCGDSLTLYLKIEDDKIKDIRFLVFGCVAGNRDEQYDHRSGKRENTGRGVSTDRRRYYKCARRAAGA